MADIYTKIRHGCCGPGGLKCTCCNTKANRGKNKRRDIRNINRRGRNRLNQYIPLEE